MMVKVGCVFILLVVCLLSYPPSASAIRCFRCDHNEVSSGNNFILSFVLKQMSKVDHPECKMKNRRDRHFIDIIECPPPSDWGSTYVCGTVRGTVAATWKGEIPTTVVPSDVTQESTQTSVRRRRERKQRTPRSSRTRSRRRNRKEDQRKKEEGERRKEEEERRKEEEEQRRKEEEERRKEEEEEDEERKKDEEEDEAKEEEDERRKDKNEEKEDGDGDDEKYKEKEEDEEDEEEQEEDEDEEEDLQVQFDTLVRDCIQVPTGESTYSDRCVETSVMDGPTQYLVEEAIEALGNFDVEGGVDFKGKTCYDTHGVPVEGHQVMCPSCSFNELLSVNSLLGPLVDVFNENNEEACRLQNPSDKFHVGYRVCKPSYQGEVNKCILAEGEVSTKLLRGVGGGIDVRYNTVSRGCAQVDMMGRDRNQYRDGCHSKLPFSEPVRKLLVQGYKGASSGMGDIRFNGKVCYNNETFSTETPKEPEKHHRGDVVTSNSQRLMLTSPLLFLAFIIISLSSF